MTKCANGCPGCLHSAVRNFSSRSLADEISSTTSSVSNVSQWFSPTVAQISIKSIAVLGVLELRNFDNWPATGDFGVVDLFFRTGVDANSIICSIFTLAFSLKRKNKNLIAFIELIE